MQPALPTRFATHRALAELPWFETDPAGRIRYRGPDLGGVVDVHTHLAMAFLGRTKVDLWKAEEPTRHYLPLDRPLDLDVYMNRNFLPGDLDELSRDLTIRSLGAGGMRRSHTAPNILREMDELGITASILLPIDFPFFSRNAETYLEVAAREARLPSMGSVHAFGRRLRERLEAQKRAGAIGVKIHPGVQLVRADHPRAMEIYRACGELSLPVFWHCGPVEIETRMGREASQLKHYWPAIHGNPGTTFVLGHSGALQVEQGIQLVRGYGNVWVELSTLALSSYRRVLAEAPPDRVMFGSDWPFYHQATALAKALLATEGDPGARTRLLRENAERLFGLDVAALRSRQAAAAAPKPELPR